MKKNNKKTNIIIFIIMIIVLILIDLFIYSKFIYNERSDYVDDFSEYDYSLDEENIKEKIDIQDGKIEIIQTVTGTGNNLEGITIGFNKDFRTYNKSQIEIKIVEHETKKVISSYNNIYDETALDYIEHKFTFKKQKESLDKKYDIIINYDNSLDDNQVLYSEKNIDSGTLTINGQDYLGHISYKLHYDSKYVNTIFLLSIIIINLLSIICFYIILFKNINLDKIFLIWISVLGIIYLSIIPMYRGHDEQAHFFKAYEISQGIFNTKIENEKSIVEVPVSFTKAMLETNKETNLPNIDKGYYSSLRNSLDLKITPETIKLDGSYMAVYSCIPYIPQALTIKLASLFTDRVVLIFYLARFANLIVSIIILYISFKIIPFGKKLLFLICMIPTVMFQISTMSPDALTFTSSILFISYVLKLINDKTKITKKNVAILTIIGLVVGLCKITYIPIVLIAFVIPKTQYKDKKSKIISLTLIILIPIIINLLWLNIAGKHLALIDNNKAEAQKEFILSNPINYIRTSSYTLFTEIQTYLRQCFGAYMGQIDYVHTSDIITNIYIIMFILVVLFDDTLKDKISNFGKILIGIILLGIIALIFTSLYMQWAGYKWYFINGLQGRYFIQLLLPLGLILGQNNISKNSKIDLKKVILSGTILTNIIAIMSCVVVYI